MKVLRPRFFAKVSLGTGFKTPRKLGNTFKRRLPAVHVSATISTALGFWTRPVQLCSPFFMSWCSESFTTAEEKEAALRKRIAFAPLWLELRAADGGLSMPIQKLEHQ